MDTFSEGNRSYMHNTLIALMRFSNNFYVALAVKPNDSVTSGVTRDDYFLVVLKQDPASQ